MWSGGAGGTLRRVGGGDRTAPARTRGAA